MNIIWGNTANPCAESRPTKIQITWLKYAIVLSGVPQGRALGSIQYLIYTNDIPQRHDTSIVTSTVDTGILSIGDDAAESENKL